MRSTKDEDFFCFSIHKLKFKFLQSHSPLGILSPDYFFIQYMLEWMSICDHHLTSKEHVVPKSLDIMNYCQGQLVSMKIKHISSLVRIFLR